MLFEHGPLLINKTLDVVALFRPLHLLPLLLLPFRSSVLEMNAVFIVPKLLQGDKEYINLSVSSQAYVAGNRLGGTVLHVLTAFKPIKLH